MVQFLSVNFFFSWISSIFVGFFKSFRFFVSPWITTSHNKYCTPPAPTHIHKRAHTRMHTQIYYHAVYSICLVTATEPEY